MKRYAWLVLVVGCTLMLACESSKQIGSACKGGECPEAIAAVQGATCTVTDTGFDTTFMRGDAGPPDPVICLPEDIAIEDSGVVDCSVYVAMNADGSGDAGTARCADVPYLEAAPGLSDGTCRVHQLTSKERAAGKDGWYYDPAQNETCTGGKKRIVFTDGALPLDGHVSGTCLFASVATEDAGAAVPIAACGPLPAKAARHVGDACQLAITPPGGFDSRTATLQTGADECGGGACVVYHLGGDPSPDCKGDNCVVGEEVSQHVYCTCRCDAPPDQAASCECPDGFSCQPVIENGPDTLRGSYCVRD
jgi:hypothetical protein